MKKLTFLTIILIVAMGNTHAQKTDILTEGFESGGIPADWSQINEATNDGVWNVQTGGLNNYYPDHAHTGTQNAHFNPGFNPSVTKLVTPEIDLPSGGTLNFWWASHTYFGPGDIDFLTVFYKDSFMGEWVQLGTFTEGSDEWVEATFSLPASSQLYIAFEGSYQGGMHPVVDDILVYTSDVDLGIADVQPIIAFGTETNPKVTVHNYGLVEATNYIVTVTIDGTTYNEIINDGEAIAAGEELLLEFPIWILPGEGTYEITATVEIDGDGDANNNTMAVNCEVDQTPSFVASFICDQSAGMPPLSNPSVRMSVF